MAKNSKIKKKFRNRLAAQSTGDGNGADNAGVKAFSSGEEAFTAAQSLQKQQPDEMKKEFIRLGFTVLFLIVVLAGIYYYDSRNHILDSVVHKMINGL